MVKMCVIQKIPNTPNCTDLCTILTMLREWITSVMSILYVFFWDYQI